MTGLVRLVGIVAFAGTAAAADPTPEQLVKDLASPAFAVREKATAALWKMGDKARPAVAAAAASADPEVAKRAQEILDKFEWGIFPDTPTDVLKHIREYRSGVPVRQQAAVGELLKLGEPALPTLRAVLSKDTSPAAKPVFDALAARLRTEVPLLLFDGKLDRAEALLALNALGPSTPGLLDYAVLLHLRGRSKEGAAALEEVRKAGGARGTAAANALVVVYRVGGDGAKAKALAKELLDAGLLVHPPYSEGRTPAPNLYEALLEDLGAWGELAGRAIPNPVNSADGLKAFHLRLAGKTKEANEILDRQKDADVGEWESAGVDPPTLALMLNDRSADGIDRMRARGNAPHILADVLSSRMAFQDALDLLAGKKADAARGPEAAFLRQLYDSRRAFLLARLGKRDASAQVFAQVAEAVAGLEDYLAMNGVTQLVRAEVRSGRYDLACEHFGRVLARLEAEGNPWYNTSQDPFELIFDADADSARLWWRLLRAAKPADEPPGATMTRVRSLLAGTATKAEFDHALQAAGRDAPLPASAEGQLRAVALAAAYRAAGKAELAVAELTKVADALAKGGPRLMIQSVQSPPTRSSRAWVFGVDERFKFWVELGDLLAEQGRHRDAAARLEQGWRANPDNAVLLYLSGRALVAAGDEKEGRRRIDLSHWVALGNSRVRGRFLEELATRRFVPDAKRERELVRATAWVSELYIGNVWNQVARASVMARDFPTAANANRRALHYLLRQYNVSYVEGYAYLTVPLAVRAYTARGLLHAGKVAEAVALAKECLAVMPGHVDLVVGMVPELDKRGHKAEADELFRLAWVAYGKVIADNPESGWARYSAAWVAAACRRELAAAADHAKKAVELDPEVRAHKEAQAEVHFRRGERDKAVALMQALVAADRRSHHYKKQLDRYRTADPASPLPDGDDD